MSNQPDPIDPDLENRLRHEAQRIWQARPIGLPTAQLLAARRPRTALRTSLGAAVMALLVVLSAVLAVRPALNTPSKAPSSIARQPEKASAPATAYPTTPLESQRPSYAMSNPIADRPEPVAIAPTAETTPTTATLASEPNPANALLVPNSPEAKLPRGPARRTIVRVDPPELETKVDQLRREVHALGQRLDSLVQQVEQLNERLDRKSRDR